MAEVVTSPLRVKGIFYPEATLNNYAHRLSRLKPVEAGDRCCNCGGDCDEEGFAWESFTAKRINGHPLCSRPKCLDAQLDEFAGKRSGCRCGRAISEKRFSKLASIPF